MRPMTAWLAWITRARRDGIMTAPAEQQHISMLQRVDRRGGTNQIPHADRRNFAFERPGETADLLGRHRVTRISRLKQQVAKMTHRTAVHSERVTESIAAASVFITRSSSLSVIASGGMT